IFPTVLNPDTWTGSVFEPRAARAPNCLGIDLRPAPRARIDQMVPQTRGPEFDPAHGAPVLAGRHARGALRALERHLGGGGKSDAAGAIPDACDTNRLQDGH